MQRTFNLPKSGGAQLCLAFWPHPFVIGIIHPMWGFSWSWAYGLATYRFNRGGWKCRSSK